MSSTSSAGHGGAPLPLRRILSRHALIVALSIAFACALAWAWLLANANGGDMGAMGMPTDPWSAGYLLPAILMWAIMMIAMMLPSAAPMILLNARLDRSPSEGERAANSFAFAAAYLLVWIVFSAIAAIAQASLIAVGRISAMDLAVGDPMVAAALLAAAAAYELTSAKRLCLEKCQSPLHFVLRHRRPGARGAFRFGVLHGLFCLGCCWALMLLLFVGGVMNLAWIAALGAIVIAEKWTPPRWKAHRWIALLLLVGAALLAIPAF